MYSRESFKDNSSRTNSIFFNHCKYKGINDIRRIRICMVTSVMSCDLSVVPFHTKCISKHRLLRYNLSFYVEYSLDLSRGTH